jgi:membrane associated rhomboid family serine protease
LLAVAAAQGPWFASRHSAETGVPRERLDEPLAVLRLAGLVRVSDWVKGQGQGYVLTPEGEHAAANPAALAQLKTETPPAPTPAAFVENETAEVPALAGEPADDSSEPPAEGDFVIRPPVVVPALLAANALWFFVCVVVSIRWGLSPSRSLSEGHPDVLLRFGAVSGPDLLNGEWWRLLSSCFVHIGVLHLIGNLFALAMMGPLAELLWGRTRLLLIYFVSGLAGSALAMALRPDTILAGASGAIWGIQMSLFAWLFAFRRHLPPELAGDWFRRLCVVFVLNAGVSFLPGVSWEGHLGGGAAGFLVAGLLNAARFGDARRRASAWIVLALLPMLCVGGLAVAMESKEGAWAQLRQRLAAREEARAAAEQTQKLRAAEEEFKTQVVPRLAKLAPEAVKQPEWDAGLLVSFAKRSPERVSASRAKVEALKKEADEAVRLTAREPTGIEQFDRHRQRAHAFAVRRAESFELLLKMLAAPAPPDAAAWAAWQSARAAADKSWAELTAK